MPQSKFTETQIVVLPQANAVWAVDFMSDTLYRGLRFRTLSSLDEGVREKARQMRLIRRSRPNT